jgi:hypothetical protein
LNELILGQTNIHRWIKKMTQEIVLINANIIRPPVSPVGLEYVAEAMIRARLPLRVVDLAFEADWRSCLRRELSAVDVLFIGISVRNTDDCSFISGKSFLPWIKEVVAEVRKYADAPVFLGGVGFSVMPQAVVEATGADGGIAGDGEDAIVALAQSTLHKSNNNSMPNLVFRNGNDIMCNPRKYVDLEQLPAASRSIFDNKRYEAEGAMVGIETKRGCAQTCVYCADVVAKGDNVRLRPPDIVTREFKNLVAQGVTYFHTCDSEFNLPISHAKDVCRALIRSGVAGRIRWYAYCAPAPFDHELLTLMKEAGCAGINFGVDSLDDGQLRRLGRHFSTENVRHLVTMLNKEKFNYFFDLMVGGTGETQTSLKITIDRVRQYRVAAAGISVGVRVYPGTRLAQQHNIGEITHGLHPDGERRLETPVFYVSLALGEDVPGFICSLIGDDQRFMVLAAPGEQGSYNYAGDDLLQRMIKEGARGAYWDILRKHTGLSSGRGS